MLYHNSSFGPIFGGGDDISICDDSNIINDS